MKLLRYCGIKLFRELQYGYPGRQSMYRNQHLREVRGTASLSSNKAIKLINARSTKIIRPQMKGTVKIPVIPINDQAQKKYKTRD